MKNKSSAEGRKLNLSKRTISNLSSSKMRRVIGGVSFTCTEHTNGKTQNCTQNQNTCLGHKSCYTCL